MRSACDPATISLSSLFGSSSITSIASSIQTVSQTFTGSQNVNLTGSLFFSYVSGQTFGAGFRLNGGLGNDNGGLVDFLNSATISAIILPQGASLTTASATNYNVVTQQVPEPGCCC